MPQIVSRFIAQSASAKANQTAMLDLIAAWRAIEQRAVIASAKAKPLFDKRKQLLPRERLACLLDAGAPWLELSSVAGYGLDQANLSASVPGAINDDIAFAMARNRSGSASKRYLSKYSDEVWPDLNLNWPLRYEILNIC